MAVIAAQKTEREKIFLHNTSTRKQFAFEMK